MYKIILDTGVVVRTEDNHIIAPTQSEQEQDYIDYLAWVEAGNSPVVIETRDPAERDRELLREQKKLERQQAVDRIIVTTSSGKQFDGDETSQLRMTRAIMALQITSLPEITWVLHDNTPTSVTLQELQEALILAAQGQSRLWVITV